MPESTVKHATSCTLCVILAFFFAVLGLAKLVAPAAAQRAFAEWGHPEWFPIFVGTLELLGAVLLLHRRTSTLAAAILAGVMLGAVATHLRSQEYVAAMLPGLLLLPIAGVGYCRRLDATWMRRLASGRHGGRTVASDLAPSASVGTARGSRWLSDRSRAAQVRIADPRHADVPDGAGVDHQRWA